MWDQDDEKGKAELLQEVETLRRRIAELSQSKDITERKKAEEELRESEKKWRLLAENIPDVILTVGKDGMIQFLNRTVAGFSPEDSIGTTIYEYVPPEQHHIMRKSIERVFLTGKPDRYEIDGAGEHGPNTRWETRVVPIMRGAQVLAVNLICTDITERKWVEEKLRESEEKYRDIVEKEKDIIYTLDEKGNITFASPAVETMLGYRPEEVVGKHFIALIPKEWHEKTEADFNNLLKEGEITAETVLLDKQGQAHFVEYASTIIKEGNKVTGTRGIVRDITERKKAAEALKQYQFMVESAHDAIFFKDRKSRYIIANNKTLEAFGLSREQVIGKNDYEIMPNKEEARKNIVDDNLVFKTGKRTEITKKMTGTNGQERWFHGIKAPQFDGKGKIIGLIGVARDITERVRRKEELSIYRDKMTRAEQLASLGTLSATLAHELAQPLTTIRLSIENSLVDLETTSCPDTVTEGLKDSLTEVSNAASIVDRVRNFARESSEKTVGQVDLKAVAERIVKLLNESARRARVSLRLKGMEKLPTIYLNEKDLEQLFFALVDNAIQAADGKKNRQLIIGGALKDEHIELRFSDNCGGIAPENVDKIFEPFFTTKPAGEGTGLGLCIVQRITSRAGGKVRIESKAGKGSTFFVTLPINGGRRS